MVEMYMLGARKIKTYKQVTVQMVVHMPEANWATTEQNSSI